MTKEELFKRKEIEELFEGVIQDLRNTCYHSKKGGIYLGIRKIGIIRYFLSIRLDGIIKWRNQK